MTTELKSTLTLLPFVNQRKFTELYMKDSVVNTVSTEKYVEKLRFWSYIYLQSGCN
jgi:hypothetical protein